MNLNKMISQQFALVLLLAASGFGQTPDFEMDVLPILKSRCFECHGAPYKDKRGRMKFAKAGLRLDGVDHIVAGAVVVPKSPQSSMLVEYISLPAGDPDIMPPRGKPLSQTEIQTIYTWVNDGANYGKWKGASKRAIKKTAVPSTATEAKSIRVLKELGNGLKPLDPKMYQGLLTQKAQISPVFPGSGLLRVSFARAKDPATNEDLKKLSPLFGRIAELNLSSSKIEDRGLASLKKMTKLVRLDLHKCAITDAGVGALASLKELRYLNLYGTQISDAGLPHLSMLKRLESLYVWQTKVTAEGVARMAKVLPQTKISHKIVLPAPPPADAGNNRRRRN